MSQIITIALTIKELQIINNILENVSDVHSTELNGIIDIFNSLIKTYGLPTERKNNE